MFLPNDLYLGPLGRVSGAVLSLIGPSALSVNVLPGLCHSGSLCVSSNLPGLVFFVLGIGFLADKMLLVFCFYVSHSRSCNPWICVLLAYHLNIEPCCEDCGLVTTVSNILTICLLMEELLRCMLDHKDFSNSKHECENFFMALVQ